MHRLQGVFRDYAWGSRDAIPEALHIAPTGGPVAELWLGAHRGGPSRIVHDDGAALGGHQTLADAIAADPVSALGADVVARFGPELPFLLKLIAPERALSLQVHPSVARARSMCRQEDNAGIPVDDPRRNYRDANHKPELILALTDFEALAGFRTAGHVLQSLNGLKSVVAQRVAYILQHDPSARGMRKAFSMFLRGPNAPTAEELTELSSACADRLSGTSPTPEVDANVVKLATDHPGDPGIVAGLLLNPVTLSVGEALFVPAGCVHAYMRGLGVEIMASSDNVVRAGLTTKHVDVSELLGLVEFVPSPPMRIEPDVVDATKTYRVPVDDFQLSSITLSRQEARESVTVPGTGSRIILCLGGELLIQTSEESLLLSTGDALFVGASEPTARAVGSGTLVVGGTPPLS